MSCWMQMDLDEPPIPVEQQVVPAILSPMHVSQQEQQPIIIPQQLEVPIIIPQQEQEVPVIIPQQQLVPIIIPQQQLVPSQSMDMPFMTDLLQYVSSCCSLDLL